MRKHFKIVAISVFLGGFFAPAVAQNADAPDPGTVMATVNGQEITLGHMIAARATLPQQYNEAPADQLFSGILQQLIQQTALAQTVETVSPLVTLTLENEERSLKAATAVEAALQEAVSEDDLKDAYDAQFADFVATQEFNASHILVETEEEAVAVKEALDGGANFAATAREKSTGPSGPNGGELGWFSKGMMVPSFEEAALALGVGEISDPVETQFGWHVIILNDTRSTEAPSFDSIKEDLRIELNNAAARDIITNAAEGFDVGIPENADIDPAILSQPQLLRP